MIWVIVSDATNCRIYSYERIAQQLKLIKNLQHSASRLKDYDLMSDKPGHYMAGNAGHGSFVGRSDPHDNEKNQFAQLLASELEAGRNSNSYAQLIIIAPPHMTGLLAKHLNKHVDALVISKVNKDLMNLKDQELSHFLHTNWQDIVNNSI